MNSASRRHDSYSIITTGSGSCILLQPFFFFFLKATKSIDGTEKSIPPKKHLQEVPRTPVRVSREGESTCQTSRSHSSDRATSPRLSISRNSDLDDVDKDPHILITRYFLSKRLGALLTIGYSYRAIGHTGLVPKRSIDPESASGEDPSVFSFGITCGRLESCYSDAERNCLCRVLAFVVSHVFPLFLSFTLSLSYAVHNVY